ncbi:hypothetical protein BGZ72_007953 [Mortierella alpina]|nr:hypothetical protein BGZ72_007953 [Mortierella alpina]
MRPPTATAARPVLASFRRLACSTTPRTARLPASCRYPSIQHTTTTAQITHRPSFFFNVLRPYHVSIRTLDQRHSAAAVSPPCPPDSDSNKAAPGTAAGTDASKKTCTHNHDHDDGHIQPQQQNPIPPNTDPKARMLIGFTCTVCNHRSHKTMSKHAYQHGVVIMQCDHCKNRHLIADHLGWFKTGGVTVEDLVKERGETVQKLTKSYQLVKDGAMASTTTKTAVADDDTTTGTAAEIRVKKQTIERTELEIAMEKAAEGMLEWIPKELLDQEQDRMKKSQELLDHSKKQD